MATLVLTTVGSLAGGPVGGAVGALIGNRIDGGLLGGSGRQGPRLGDLAVQTSSYGSAIPKLFGRMRVAGTVIWATDLKETATRSGGGKGRPGTTGYSYSASFAVAVSARRVRSIGRIWADGMLLRGAAGDWKTATGYRFHDGDEGQAADPLIAAVEGADQAPAYRGLAYMVFEDLQLAAYGNRIPSLSFEVEADAGPVKVGAIAGAISGGAIVDATATRVAGYAASGDTVRGAIETLVRAIPLTLVEDGDGLMLGEGAGVPVDLAEAALGAAAGGRGGVRRETDLRAAGTVPDEATLSYYAVERDYQAGLQRARRGGPGRRVDAIELPAVLAAEAARAIVEARLAADWAARREAVIRLPWRWMRMRPGQAATVPGSRERWRVASVTLDRMVVEVRLVGIAAAGGGMAPAVAGRATGQPDRPHGPTRIALFELPMIDGAADGGIPLWVAAAGIDAGWRQAVLEGSVDDGATLTPIGRTAPGAVMGRVAMATPAAGAHLFDDRTTITVELANDAMVLEGRSDAAMLAGANLALLGEELIQFGQVEQVGVRRFRIGRLLRGRHGTEGAIAAHRAGEDFILIDRARLASMPVAPGAAGSIAAVLATGIGDVVPVVARRTITGTALRPYAPAHLRAVRLAGGDIEIGWIRRSRAGAAWSDGVDAPLAEEVERYRVTILAGSRAVRVVDVAEPRWRYPADWQAADGGTSAGVRFSVVQLGTAAASMPRIAGIRV